MINFLLEITTDTESEVIPTVTTSIPTIDFTRSYNIYEINISSNFDEAEYWFENEDDTKIDWDYNQITGSQIALYFGQYLLPVNDLYSLLTTPYSIYLNRIDYTVYVNLEKHPHLYSEYSTNFGRLFPFLSAPIDPQNPSHNMLRGVQASVRLVTPTTSEKLSDSISGIKLNQGFSVTLHNNDGFFDNEVVFNNFNTPVYLKKSIVEKPTYDDFKLIKHGLVENIETSFDSVTITIADRLRAMSNPACDVVVAENFPEIEIDNSALGKNIQILFGTKRVKPLLLNQLKNADDNETTYTILLPEHTANVTSVRDNDGNEYFHDAFLVKGRYLIITLPENMQVDSFIAVSPTLRIGEIIKNIISQKAGIEFNNSIWDMNEAEQYIQTSAFVNVLIESGDVRSAIQNVLTSDMAYFFQKTDGRFTIRKYGKEYAAYSIDNTMITKSPDKTYADAHNNYFSSCVIQYAFDDNTYLSYLDADMEYIAEARYKRRRRATFKTDLIYLEDAVALADLLTKRYLEKKQRIKLAVGVDLSSMELLDKVTVKIQVNGRQFSKAERFVVIEINHAQDTLVLEEYYE